MVTASTFTTPPTPPPFVDPEVERVKQHLLGAEQLCATRDLSGLTDMQRETRALLLEELAHYREAGVFPQNPDFDFFAPYFIDAAGTRCAMAHLMEIGGAGDLVHEIAATRNNAYVRELADDSRVLAWLDAAGLLPEEAARIQPAYCPEAAATCMCKPLMPAGAPSAVARGTADLGDAGDGSGVFTVQSIFGTATDACSNVKVGDALKMLSYPSGDDVVVALRSVTAEAAGITRDSGTLADGGDAGPPSTGMVCVATQLFSITSGTGNASARCGDGQFGSTLPSVLSLEETFAMLSTNDCKGYLAAKGSAWTTKPPCTGPSTASDVPSSNTGGGGGCSSAPDHPTLDAVTQTACILAAIVAYRAARRVVRK